jgi:hypothetical protein
MAKLADSSSLLYFATCALSIALFSNTSIPQPFAWSPDFRIGSFIPDISARD